MKTLIVQTDKKEYRFNAEAFDLQGDILKITDDGQQRIAVVTGVTAAYFEDSVAEEPKKAAKAEETGSHKKH